MSVNITPSDITTYGALILPFNKEDVFKQSTVDADPETATEQAGNIISAIENGDQKSAIQNAIEASAPMSDIEFDSEIPNFAEKVKGSITQTAKKLANYMNDNRDKISGLINDIGAKFSGVAVAQAVMNGKVTAKEAADYLFTGFAPALGVQGSQMGYTGLNQMKEALLDGSINIGSFISGFSKTLQGIKDFKDMMNIKDDENAQRIVEFDLTISHNEQYQSETPDRRVQSGQSLNEYVHNMPETITVNCALQEGKRYSKDEFRAILQYLRERKETVQLVLGDEIFDSLILTNFNPTHDCTKSGMDYTLEFKKIVRSDIDTTTEVTIQKIPIKNIENDLKSTPVGGLSAQSVSRGVSSGISGNLPKVDLPKIENPNFFSILPDGMSPQQASKLFFKGGYSAVRIMNYPEETIADYQKRFGDYYD